MRMYDITPGGLLRGHPTVSIASHAVRIRMALIRTRLRQVVRGGRATTSLLGRNIKGGLASGDDMFKWH